MEEGVVKLHAEKGKKVLMLTGVRMGESAPRDGRIIASCSKDGAECGQGWFQTSLPGDVCDTLAPILHWRVCHVWEWLKHWAPLPEFGDFSTEIIADAYGGDEAEEHNARTGCVACPLVEKDYALDILLRNHKWHYLKPLKELKPLYRWMRFPANRLRKTGEKEGGKNKQRMGPLTFEARKAAYERILDIERRVNEGAIAAGMPTICILNDEEKAHIQHCWEIEQWPDGWEGDEPTGDVIMDKIFSDGTRWPDLFGK
jgi:DNA sulfur modification protein DndC